MRLVSSVAVKVYWAGLIAGATLMGIPSQVRAAPPVVDVVGNMSSSQFSSLIAPQNYKDWGNEPFIAVNPTNPNNIAVSGFGYGTSSTSSGSSIWYSTNGGSNWTMTFPFQAPANGVSIPHDQTFQYDSSGNLHAAMLGTTSNGDNIYQGVTSNPANNVSTTWTAGGTPINHVGTNNADQPFMANSGNHIYVGYDNFSGVSSIQVARSDNNGSTFTAANDLPISNTVGGYVNPGTRLATDSNGNAYAIFGLGTNEPSQGLETVNYRLNSYQLGNAAWDFTSTNGQAIASGNSHQIDSTGATWFGGVNELRGNDTAIASDRAGNNIYTVYGMTDSNGVDRLYLQDFQQPSAGTFVSTNSNPLPFSVDGQRAALPSIAVTDNGTVFAEYDSYIGPNNNPLAAGGTFQAHLATSVDNGQTFTDQILYSWTAPAAPNNPNYGGNRELGDYQYLTAMGNNVYGTFAARGDVNAGGINDTTMIVPFYFTATTPMLPPQQTPEPNSLTLAAIGGALALGWVRRRCRSGSARV